MRTYLTAMVIAGGAALAQSAAAGAPDRAERAFDEGVARMKAGHFDEACPLVAESQRLDPLPGTLFTLAECEALRGRIATAFRLYGEFLRIVGELPADKRTRYLTRVELAAQQRSALEPRIPELTLLLPPSAPAGTVVERDGERIGAAGIGVPAALEPGDHEIVVQAPGGPRTRVAVRLATGEKRTLTLEVKAPPPAAPQPPALLPIAPRAAPREAPSARRIAAYAAAGVGAGGLIVGAIFGGIAIKQASVIHRECSGAVCTPAGKEAADAIARTGAASTIGFGVGLAGAGAALALRLTEPSKRVRVGVSAAGPGIAIEGAW